MYSHLTASQLIACRNVALEQNTKLFEEANTLAHSAFDLLDSPHLDSDMFFLYMQLRDKANTLFREALDHLVLLNEEFPSPTENYKTQHTNINQKEDVNG